MVLYSTRKPRSGFLDYLLICAKCLSVPLFWYLNKEVESWKTLKK